MEITTVEPIALESAVGTVSLQGGETAFDATVRPVLVRIETDTGIVGLGETYLDDPTGDKAHTAAQGMAALGNHLVGRDPRDVTRRWQELYVHVKRSGNYRALSAVDEALWDIAGKAAGEPVYRLLGGQAGDVHAYATFPHEKPAHQLVEDGQWLAEKGFPTMKIAAVGDLQRDRDRVTTVAEGIPDDLGLAIDANTSYDFPSAHRLAQTASERELEWFEEPIAHTDFEGQAELNRRVTVPISGYQNHVTHYPALDHLTVNALEIYQPAFDYVGGITAGWRVATLVEAFDKRFVPHAFGPVINYSASLHVAAASPACSLIEFGVYNDSVADPGRYVASPYVANQADVSVQDGGLIEPPEAPGLGLELDMAVVEEYRTN